MVRKIQGVYVPIIGGNSNRSIGFDTSHIEGAIVFYRLGWGMRKKLCLHLY